jgi:hypothetical protein
MPVWTDWELDLDVDQVLRGQGADPQVIRSRRPALVAATELALTAGRPLLQPVVAYRDIPVREIRHERLSLEGGGQLIGKLIGEHLAAAEHVTVVVCTIGEAIDTLLAQVMDDDPVHGLALDGLGSAAVEALAAAACRRVEAIAGERGQQVSIPLSPGMVGWPVVEGQSQIFSLMDVSEAGVSLTSSGMMIPRKSLTMVLGIGAHVLAAGTACDYCSLHETCRYQDHYAPVRPETAATQG